MDAQPPIEWVIAIIFFSVLLFDALAFGLVLVIRDTIRQRGKWGINLKPAVCTQCATPMPIVRKPTSWRQAMWGGWTCTECGFELDKYGRPTEEQNTLAKWAVLQSAEETEENRHRSESADERIRRANEQTQRGDVS